MERGDVNAVHEGRTDTIDRNETAQDGDGTTKRQLGLDVRVGGEGHLCS